MDKMIRNPFKFGDPVEGSYYLKRPQLSKLVTQFLENQIHVVLIGPRRFGKTSFTLNLLKDLEKESYSCLFIDIFNIHFCIHEKLFKHIYKYILYSIFVMYLKL